jgi:hypothetical protein
MQLGLYLHFYLEVFGVQSLRVLAANYGDEPSLLIVRFTCKIVTPNRNQCAKSKYSRMHSGFSSI